MQGMVLNSIAIVTINSPSLEAGEALATVLNDYKITIYNKNKNDTGYALYDKLDDIMAELWQLDAIIFLLATGIVVRKIAPFLVRKTTDPAVLVMSLDLKKVLPLLSGHIGGANELSELIVSRIENCISFTTTATDQTKTFAFDMFAKKFDMKIENIDKLANISNRLINKQKVKVATFGSVFEKIDNKDNLELVDFDAIDENSVVIGYENSSNLLLKPKITLGIGCNRGVGAYEIADAYNEFLQTNGLAKEDIKNIASFSAKEDEIGLLEFAKINGFEITFYKKEEINSLAKDFSHSAAQKFFEIKGVAEPSAILASTFKELIFKKVSYDKKITIAGAI